MESTRHFALVLLGVAAAGVLALFANRVTERLRVPAPLLVLVAAALAVQLIPAVHTPRVDLVEEILTVALIYILFDGGMGIGRARLRTAWAPVLSIGVLGTFLTAAGGAALLHWGFGLDWYLALLVGTAVAPTDPAVVFSVLGPREIGGRSGTVLEGESGANDPVGIALMASLIMAGGISWHAAGSVATQFLLQMAVGAAVGLLAAPLLVWLMRHVSLPGEGLYPLRTLAFVLVVYGGATVLHGSGFLAVFVTGILIGDERAPFKLEVERFHEALASLGEIVAFAVLGLTVDLHEIARTDVWVPGLVLAAVLAVVVRPIAAGTCLVPARLRSSELAFIAFAGLKGAVPLLLGELLLAAHVPDARRLYGIVAVVVVFSVLVQGSLTPIVAAALRIPMQLHEPQPWALGVRLRDEPQGVHRYTVRAGAPADGTRIGELPQLPEDAWISFVVRDRQLVTVRASTELRAGDEVLVLSSEDRSDELQPVFEG